MMLPITGAEGVAGCILMITLAVAAEVQPDAFVTVNAYEPATRSDTVVLVVEPAIDPGLMIQLPEGKPLKTTLPVATAQVGCVTAPTKGIAGVAGCGFMTTFADTGEMQPTEFLTV
jgi:hypothetical protein